MTVTFPEDYPAPELAGKEAQFEVTVNEVKAKRLPELDDEFASEAAGFDTLAELREDIAERLQQGRRARDRARVRGCRGRGRGRRGRGRGAGQAGSRARARAARGHVRGARAPGHLEGGLPADHRPGRGDARARGRARGRRRAQARGRAGGDRRGRADRADRRAGPRGARADRRAAGDDRREAARAAALERTPRPAARARSPPARRSSCWWREAKPISVEQAKAREKLWTPGKEGRDGDPRTPDSSGRPAANPGRRPSPRSPTGTSALPSRPWAVATVGRIPAEEAKEART